LKLLLQGVCFENLSISAKKTIAMVAMDLDNVYDVVSNISKFAATIFANLFNHKGKEENNGNMTMECD
jgi:serine protease inhibitor